MICALSCMHVLCYHKSNFEKLKVRKQRENSFQRGDLLQVNKPCTRLEVLGGETVHHCLWKKPHSCSMPPFLDSVEMDQHD